MSVTKLAKPAKSAKAAKPRKRTGSTDPQKREGVVGVCYYGKQAKTGNSLGFRFDKALFRSHPEFAGEVRGHVIAPGSMLVVAEQPTKKSQSGEEDPILRPFLSFLAQDIASSPQNIRPLSRALADRIERAVGHVKVDPDEDLGETSLL
jgi:hypothetical protein